ncbi:hypothetical protein [Microbacterium elymi]|uniref:Uncharacterized protein n=1 Tax=Microbacterium elymi TaxID=2909587 RepID=A0ABY5NM89_9MICO|nr:hypothetical protein [Microbacterium elymi]UUT36285.1 hypothetical protein L2X98_25270 [Microbacterium elymi]
MTLTARPMLAPDQFVLHRPHDQERGTGRPSDVLHVQQVADQRGGGPREAQQHAVG